ncbi:hypothetical protein MC885_009923 [Smutsia gigantea]|nr:hypothetical protein MC885_009923 [Smutsia gigantea]
MNEHFKEAREPEAVPLKEATRVGVMTNLSHLYVEGTEWVVPFVNRLDSSMEKISCKMFRFCFNCGATRDPSPQISSHRWDRESLDNKGWPQQEEGS